LRFAILINKANATFSDFLARFLYKWVNLLNIMIRIPYLLFLNILIVGVIDTQAQSIPANPRYSTKPSSVKDTLSTQNKVVTIKDTVQKDPNRPIKGGVFTLSGVLGFPQNDFNTNTNNAIGYGFDIAVLINLSGKRSRAEWEHRFINVYLGGNFQWMRQDGTRDSYSFEDSYSTTTVSSKVRNNLTGIGLLTRAELFPGAVKLFFELGAGTRLFSGAHHIEVENRPLSSSNPDDVRTTTTNNNLRSALIGNYSYGGGLRICKNEIGIEFKFTSLKGTTAEYVDIKSIQFNRSNNTVSYETKNSKTDIIVFQIGISGRF
jgi:hypothetical protein